MKRHLVTSPQQFHECIFLYFLLPFLFLTFLGISSESKCPLLSHAQEELQNMSQVTSLKSQTQKKPRFCCSVKHKLHSTNPEFSPRAGTLLFLSPNMQATLRCVLCTPVIHSRGGRGGKLTWGRKCSFNK